MGGFKFDLRLAHAPALVAFVALLAGPPAGAAGITAAELSAAGAHTDAAGRLQIDAHFDCTLEPPIGALTAAGLAVTSPVKAGSLCMVEGWILPGDVSRIEAVVSVTHVSAPSYVPLVSPHTLRSPIRSVDHAAVQKSSGAATIDQNGVSIVRADQFTAQTGVTGAGVTVGVQSSGVYSLSKIEARGELPSSVKVLFPAGNTTPVAADEGTVLLEEIHAVAPGAKLVYCGPSTFADFTSCLSELISAGATIVLDDTGFASDGLMSQDNDQTSAISQILGQSPNVLMMSSAGNNDGTYWEGSYTPVSTTGTSLPALSCPSGSATADDYVASFGSATSETLTVTGGGANFPLLLAWADPPGQITSRFDVYWFVAGSSTPLGCFTTSGNATDQLEQNLSLLAGTYNIVVASPDASASGKFLKLWAGGDGLTFLSVSTSGGLISPQAMVPGLLTIGAVNGSDGVGDTIEPFSSTGPVSVRFPTAAPLQAPYLVAPDGINVDATGTYFAGELFPDGNFYGTSAAVPNAAAVAALLRSAFPSLTVTQVTAALQSGATVLGSVAPDYVFGYGRVDALGALGTVPTPTITALSDATSTGSASSAAQSFTVTGTGTLHFAVTSSNAALVPATVVTAASPGITLSSGCGSNALTCTVTVTPVSGQAGTATVTLSVLDGADRPAAASLTFTATDPATATGTTNSGTGSSGGTHSGGGGALQSWTLLWLGVLVLANRRRLLRR